MALLANQSAKPTMAQAPASQVAAPSVPSVLQASNSSTAPWAAKLSASLAKIEKDHPGALGLYIKDLETGETFSDRADESWYLASGVKVPIAMAVLAEAEKGDLFLGEEVRIRDADKIDSAGHTNGIPDGGKASLRFLLEQMLIHSDNTASDLLIRRVGLPAVNQSVVAYDGFGPITTLGEVRRLAYGQMHANAAHLTNRDLRRLKARAPGRRPAALAGMIGVKPADFRVGNLDAAFDAYYSTHVNSAPLRAYGDLLEAIAEGRALGPAGTSILLDVMERVETGKARVRAGLPSNVVFAHKTGTQHARFCDFGIARRRQDAPSHGVIIAACVRGVGSEAAAERVLARAGRAVAQAGLFPAGR